MLPLDVAAPDIIEAARLRWIHIESPRSADRDWLEEHFDFHPLDYEDVYSRNQRPKLDQYDDYVFIVLHFPLFDKDTGRILTAELDLFLGPDYLITLPNVPLPPLAAMFERYREKDDLREEVFSKGSGYLLYKIVDTGVDAAFPMLRKMGLKLERLEDDIFEGRSSEIVRELSEAKQEIINFRKIVRPQRAVLRDLERTKQRYLQEELEIYFDDISDAAERTLGHTRELQGGRRGARVDQRVRAVASAERLVPGADGCERPAAAADAHREHLRDERALPGRRRDLHVLRDPWADGHGPAGARGPVPPPRLAVAVQVGRSRSAGPTYRTSGRISRLSAACSSTCAVQPA